MRHAGFFLVALATFALGVGSVFSVQWLEEVFADSSAYVPPIQLQAPHAIALLEENGCGALVVRIESGGQLSLNRLEMGTIDDTEPLRAKLKEIFRLRSEAPACDLQAEDLPYLPREERILKTVFIKAPRSVKYGDVTGVLDAVRSTGANPIGLVSDKSDSAERLR